jgi:hypothetical protein
MPRRFVRFAGQQRAPVVILYTKTTGSTVQFRVWDQGSDSLVHTATTDSGGVGSIRMLTANTWQVSLNILYGDRWPNYEVGIFTKGGSFVPVTLPTTRPSEARPSDGFFTILSSDNGPTWRYQFSSGSVTPGDSGLFSLASSVLRFGTNDLDGVPPKLLADYLAGVNGLMVIQSESNPAKTWAAIVSSAISLFAEFDVIDIRLAIGGAFTAGETFTVRLLEDLSVVDPTPAEGDNIVRIYNQSGLQATINPAQTENARRYYRAAGNNLIDEFSATTAADDSATIYRQIGSGFIRHISSSGTVTTLNRVGSTTADRSLAMDTTHLYGLNLSTTTSISTITQLTYNVAAGTYQKVGGNEIVTGPTFGEPDISILDVTAWPGTLSGLAYLP